MMRDSNSDLWEQGVNHQATHTAAVAQEFWSMNSRKSVTDGISVRPKGIGEHFVVPRKITENLEIKRCQEPLNRSERYVRYL